MPATPNPQYLTQQLKETEKKILHFASIYCKTKDGPTKTKAMYKIEQLSIIRNQWKQQL